MVSEIFVPASAQFCFQSNISNSQALLCAQTNAKCDLRHVLVLDLENSYDKVNMAKLRKVLTNHSQHKDLNIVIATLGLMRVRTRNDPTVREANITRGVRHGAPSSPIYFNAYINELAKEVEEIKTGKASWKGQRYS